MTKANTTYPNRKNAKRLPKPIRSESSKICSLAKQYYVDFDLAKAAVRSRLSLPEAKLLATDPRFEWQLQEHLETVTEEDLVTREQIIVGLKREAYRYGDDATSASRTAAFTKLATLMGFDKPIDINLNVKKAPTINLTLKGKVDKNNPKLAEVIDV